MKFVAFDLETLKSAPEDHQGDYNLGVTCIGACIVRNGSRKTRVWHGEEEFGCYRKKMLSWEVREFTDWLESKAGQGFDVVSWNGSGFDFKVLELCDDNTTLSDLAYHSVDPFFQMLAEKGFGVSLKAVSTGMNVQGKMDGMDGLKATQMWVTSRSGQEKVLEYVKQDAVATANVYEAIVKYQALRWITRRGTMSTWYPQMHDNGDGTMRMLTVEEASKLPLPDTSWMTDPWVRTDFFDWMME